MKTKDLIKRLEEADPSGEVEVSVGNVDIFFVDMEPAYYDGCLEILIRDEDNPYYNIIGGKITSKGSKVVIHTMSIQDAIWEDHALPIEYDEYSEEKYKHKLDEERRKAQDNDQKSIDRWTKKLVSNYYEGFHVVQKKSTKGSIMQYWWEHIDRSGQSHKGCTMGEINALVKGDTFKKIKEGDREIWKISKKVL